MKRRLIYCVLLCALAPVGYAASAPAVTLSFSGHQLAALLDKPPDPTDTTPTDTTPTDTTPTDTTPTDTTPTDTTPTTNTTTTTTTVPPGQPSPPPPPPVTTVPPTSTSSTSPVPASVAGLTAVVGDGLVKLTYKIPTGVDHVVIKRSASSEGERIVYSGKGTTFTDRGLTNGVPYRYVVTCVDDGGNDSAGVVIVLVPRKNFLRAPKDGARLRKPPKLAWSINREASYYNLQVFRGKIKILSVWPKKPTRALAKKWRFSGRRYSLVPGVYTWFVWPGYGARSHADYGDLMGSRTFRIVR